MAVERTPPSSASSGAAVLTAGSSAGHGLVASHMEPEGLEGGEPLEQVRVRVREC